MLEEDKKYINLIVKNISRLNGVSAIFLFGSQSNGKSRDDSDIDIAVLTKDISRKKELEIIGYGNEKTDISIFSNLPLIIQFRVLNEGRLLFSKNQKDIHDIKIKVFRDYLDYSVFINNFYKRIIKNV